MIIEAYQNKLQKLKSYKLRGIDTSKQDDALQNAIAELFDHNFGNKAQAVGTLEQRYKARLIDLYRKDEKLDFLSDFVGHIVPEQPEPCKIDPDALIKRAKVVLNPKDHYVFELFITGWTGNDIAKILEVKKAAISRRLGRIIEKLKVDVHFVELTEVAL